MLSDIQNMNVGRHCCLHSEPVQGPDLVYTHAGGPGPRMCYIQFVKLHTVSRSALSFQALNEFVERKIFATNTREWTEVENVNVAMILSI